MTRIQIADYTALLANTLEATIHEIMLRSYWMPKQISAPLSICITPDDCDLDDFVSVLEPGQPVHTITNAIAFNVRVNTDPETAEQVAKLIQEKISEALEALLRQTFVSKVQASASQVANEFYRLDQWPHESPYFSPPVFNRLYSNEWRIGPIPQDTHNQEADEC